MTTEGEHIPASTVQGATARTVERWAPAADAVAPGLSGAPAREETKTPSLLDQRTAISDALAKAAQKRRGLQLLLDEGLHGASVAVVQALIEDLYQVADLTNEASRQFASSSDALPRLDFTVQIASITRELAHVAERVNAAALRQLDEAFALVAKRFAMLKRTALRTEQELGRDVILKRVVMALAVAASVVALVTGIGAIRRHHAMGVRRAAFLKLPAAQRVRDLIAIRDALEAYHSKYGAYPKAETFDGIHSCWGRSSPDWIPGLVPEFLPALPRDPRANDHCGEQYLYRSNGKNYKIITHEPDDCATISEMIPDMVDPARGCNAYGFWTFTATYL
jgi:hypothetical protein